MQNRQPGFTPGRLTLAREINGLSKAELADRLGLTRAAVGQYESGERLPGPDKLLAFSEHLGQPVEFFLLPDAPQRHGTVFYRSLRSTEARARLKAKALMVMLWDAIDYFQGLVTLPPVNMPNVGALPESPFDLTESMIEGAAQLARQHWALGDKAPTNIVWLLEDAGAIVMRTDLDNERLEALSEWREGRPYILLNDTKRNAFRSRADIAHELGHLLLHRHVTEEQLLDKPTFDLIEAQAWQFAQAFLLPEVPFLRDVWSTSLDTLLALKPKWKVSVAFMIQRLKSVGILEGEKYVNTRKYLSQRGWRLSEPYDPETEPERPLLLGQLMAFLQENKIQTPDQVRQGIGADAQFLERLLALQTGTFTPRTNFNIVFTPKRIVAG